MQYPKPHLSIHAFGDWAVLLDGVLVQIPSTKANAILAYIAFSERKFHRREDLAKLFWPEVETRQAKASLRQTLFELKKSILSQHQDALHISNEVISIDRTSVSTDFKELLQSLKDRNFLDRKFLTKFESENFLPGFTNITSEFSDWVFQERGSLQTVLTASLKSALTDEATDPKSRREIALALRELDPFDEQAVRALMRLYFELGEVPSAIKLYDELYLDLEDQMDVEPSIETQELAAEIKLGRLETSPKEFTEMTVAAKSTLPEARIAVLPFETLGPAGPDKFIVLGLLDEITHNLVRFHSFAVISSNSTRQYLGHAPPISKLHAELGAEYVVLGSLRKHQGRIAITVQVVETKSQKVVDARIHECAEDDVFSLNSKIATRIANSILPNVNRAELTRTMTYPAQSLGPYHLVMRAKDSIFQLTQDTLETASGLLDEALILSPYFTPAHALKADLHSIRVWQRWSSDPIKENGLIEHHARRAITLSGEEPRAAALLAHTLVLNHQRYDEALRLFETARSQAPNDAEVLSWTVPTLAYVGDLDAAISNGEAAISLSPHDPFLFRYTHFLSLALYFAGQYDRSAELGINCYKDNPNYVANLRMTVAAMQAAGRTQELPELLEHHRSLVPDFRLRNYGDGPPFKDPETKTMLLNDLKSAGLPV